MAPRRRWGSMGDLLSMQERMNKLLDDSITGISSRERASSGSEPPVDICEKEDSFMLEADLPGVSLQEVEVEVKDGSLHIKGSRAPQEDAPSEIFLRQERSSGDFHRVFALPVEIEQEKVSAKLKNGVLTVVVPKKEVAKSRQITVDIQ